MPAEEKGAERPPREAGPDQKAASQQVSESPAGSTRSAAPAGQRRLRMPLNPLAFGAIAIALVASAVSLGVVLKAARLQPEWDRMRRAAVDPADLGHYAWANARLLGGETYRPGEVTIVFGSAYGAAWEMLPALQGKRVHNRSLPGQNTTRLLLRIEQDVLALRPRAMVFLPPLEGARNPERTLLHTRLIGQLAEGHGIRTALATIPPIPAEADTVPGGYLGGLRVVNRGLEELAREMNWPLLDFYGCLVGDDFYLAPEYAGTGMWPNVQGYRQATDMLAALLDRWEMGDPGRITPEGSFGLAEAPGRRARDSAY